MTRKKLKFTQTNIMYILRHMLGYGYKIIDKNNLEIQTKEGFVLLNIDRKNDRVLITNMKDKNKQKYSDIDIFYLPKDIDKVLGLTKKGKNDDMGQN